MTRWRSWSTTPAMRASVIKDLEAAACRVMKPHAKGVAEAYADFIEDATDSKTAAAPGAGRPGHGAGRGGAPGCG